MLLTVGESDTGEVEPDILEDAVLFNGEVVVLDIVVVVVDSVCPLQRSKSQQHEDTSESRSEQPSISRPFASQYALDLQPNWLFLVSL